MDIFIGIDPSINSTGVCIQQRDENDATIKENFYVIVPNSITKRAEKIVRTLDNFEYVIYSKTDLSLYKNNVHWEEYYKTYNMINIVDSIEKVVDSYLSACSDIQHIYIVQEGISYGSSIRTKSVFDLAGLNYLIRARFIDKPHTVFYIATPAEIKKFATGRGNANKATVKYFFSNIHNELTVLPKFDDIADAYFMSNYAAVLMKNDLE